MKKTIWRPCEHFLFFRLMTVTKEFWGYKCDVWRGDNHERTLHNSYVVFCVINNCEYGDGANLWGYIGKWAKLPHWPMMPHHQLLRSRNCTYHAARSSFTSVSGTVQVAVAVCFSVPCHCFLKEHDLYRCVLPGAILNIFQFVYAYSNLTNSLREWRVDFVCWIIPLQTFASTP